MRGRLLRTTFADVANEAPIITRRRLLLGVVAAAVVAGAIVLLRPDTRQSLSGASPYGQPVDRDLEAIRGDTLRVLVVRHHLVYERSPGAESGMEYELLKRIARALDLPIKAVVVERPDSLLPLLQRGAGDMIAANLGQRNPMDRWIIHTLPYRYTAPVCAILRPDEPLGINTDPSVIPDTAWVSVWSPFAPRELRFPGNDGGADLKQRTIFTDTSRFGDQPVINVALGRVRAAIVSDGSAAFFAQRFPQLAFSAPIADPVPVVFGLRSNARRLQRAIDQRLADPREKEAMALLMSAYGTDLPERGPLLAVPCAGTAAALPMDLLLPRTPREGRDLALLAAVALQWDRIDTALAPPMVTRHHGDRGTAAGEPIGPAQLGTTARYLAELDDRWRDEVPDPDQRLRFVAAGWLAGPDHVDDARALAAELKLDPQRWDGHVERAITLLALPRCFAATTVKHGFCKGADTFTGVRELVCLYEHFRAARR